MCLPTKYAGIAHQDDLGTALLQHLHRLMAALESPLFPPAQCTTFTLNAGIGPCHARYATSGTVGACDRDRASIGFNDNFT